MKNFSQFLSENLQEGNEIKPKPDFSKYQFWGLYFSASWCPPCRQFTGMLKNFYDEIRKSKTFEIVLVTHDENERDFMKYYQKMPWLAIPWSEKMAISYLTRICKPQTIPHLCIFDQDGNYVTCGARDDIAMYGMKAWNHWEDIAEERRKYRQK
ncbi:unnamed protein product [Paramecium pentaurelia]|uniref:protein-disulfide reductase n=1 Tax=Paramecium pentaurelia TaxID=43138 RepID=A0A8S1S9A5_9CILI|nr:unnamed protein product [Paramecium pentaurelia]